MSEIILSSEKGQTLVEVLITAVVIIIAVVALMRFQSNLAYNNSLVQERSFATILAEKQIETLRDFHVLNNQSPYTSYQGIASGSNSVSGPTATYAVAWVVTTVATPSYKTINVTVTWTDRRNVSQSVQLVTNVAGLLPANSANVMS